MRLAALARRRACSRMMDAYQSVVRYVSDYIQMRIVVDHSG